MLTSSSSAPDCSRSARRISRFAGRQTRRRTLTLRRLSTLDTRRHRESVGVIRLIAQPDAALVEPSERLLKQARLRITRGHGALDDVELVLVHVDPGERAGLVRVVRELELMSFDEVDGIPDEARHHGVALHEPPGCVDDRSADVSLPVPLVARGSQTGLGARRTRLRFLREYALRLTVIDDGHRVAALALRRAVDARR